MRIWTVHIPPEAAGPKRAGSVPPAGDAAAPPLRPPVLVREGFSWAAFLFSVLWLLWHRLWLAALLYLLLAVAIGLALPGPAGVAAGLALQFLLGAHAQDLRRRALSRRGYLLAHVVAASDYEEALARVLRWYLQEHLQGHLQGRPDLAGGLARAALA